MAMMTSIDPALSLVTFLYTSNPTFAEWRSAMEAVFADPAYRPGFHFLGDRRSVPAPPSREYFEQALEFTLAHADQVRGSRWATVVATPAGYGMARVAQAISEDSSPIEFGIFTDLGAALSWLRGEAEQELG
jgi:hypothetical protein